MSNQQSYRKAFNDLFVLNSPTLSTYFKRVTIDCELKAVMTYSRDRLLRGMI